MQLFDGGADVGLEWSLAVASQKTSASSLRASSVKLISASTLPHRLISKFKKVATATRA